MRAAKPAAISIQSQSWLSVTAKTAIPNANPQMNPWRDAIGNAVRVLKGSEFTISRPRDLFFAWSEIMGRIVKSKVGRAATAEAALH